MISLQILNCGKEELSLVLMGSCGGFTLEEVQKSFTLGRRNE